MNNLTINVFYLNSISTALIFLFLIDFILIMYYGKILDKLNMRLFMEELAALTTWFLVLAEAAEMIRLGVASTLTLTQMDAAASLSTTLLLCESTTRSFQR